MKTDSVITLKDIANELGVSMATVSRSLRHDRIIAPQTKARVMAAALRMGYKGASGKRPPGRRGKELSVIGVLLSGESLGGIRHAPVITEFLDGCSFEADALGLMLSLHVTTARQRGHLDENGELPTMIREHKCQAVIVQGCHHSEEDVAFLSQLLPVISFNYIFPHLAVSSVASDNVWPIVDLVAAMAAQGHRKLAWVGEFEPTPFAEQRYAGFLIGLRRSVLPLEEQKLFPDAGAAFANEGGRLFEALRQGVTGFVCVNDLVAMTLYGRFAAAGLAPPRDYSLSGYDHWNSEATEGVLLSTVDPNFRDIGRICIRLASERIHHTFSNAVHVSVSASIVPGKTIGPVPSPPAKVRK